ncbi:replication initiator [Planotetraspora thailandica]|uniref:replication initiator n=1 Tax=Planotetraspora thailandica TaxID=487172 RepID=UPI00194FA6F0|nr:replication initiator [Planotetraspora thailandica]
MIRTCWELGARPEFVDLRLRPWAHMLGFRGHFSTKSRRFSTTLGDIRQGRAHHRAADARQRHGLPALGDATTLVLGDATTLVLGHWRFAGTGYSPGEAIMAEHIRQRVSSENGLRQRRYSHPRGECGRSHRSHRSEGPTPAAGLH